MGLPAEAQDLFQQTLFRRAAVQTPLHVIVCAQIEDHRHERYVGDPLMAVRRLIHGHRHPHGLSMRHPFPRRMVRIHQVQHQLSAERANARSTDPREFPPNAGGQGVFQAFIE
jgi:hypothetical protein